MTLNAARLAILGLALSLPPTIVWAAQQAKETPVYGPNYANDRAEIEDLMSRYLYAFDWQDADAYAATFTEDGVLEFAGGTERGHEELKKVMIDMAAREKAKAEASFPPRRHRVRHYVTNLVLEVEGDTARSTSYWWEYNNDAAPAGLTSAPTGITRTSWSGSAGAGCSSTGGSTTRRIRPCARPTKTRSTARGWAPNGPRSRVATRAPRRPRAAAPPRQVQAGR